MQKRPYTCAARSPGALPSALLATRTARTALASCLAFLSIPLSPHEAFASTIPVTSCNDTGAGSLRAAVAQAADGDTVDLTNLSCSTITLTSGAISVSQNELHVVGPGPSSLVIQGVPTSPSHDRVLSATASGSKLYIDGLTIDSGYFTGSSSYPAMGGCINTFGSLSLNHVVVGNCLVNAVSPSGGGVGPGAAKGGCVAAGQLSVIDSTITGCEARGGSPSITGEGGGIYASTLYLAYSMVSKSKATTIDSNAFGGGIRAGDLIMLASSVLDCEAKRGGGVFTYGAFVTIAESTIARNYASVDAGGAYLVPVHATTSIINSTISENSSQGYVGGLLTGYAFTSVQNTTITGNTASIASPATAAGFTLIGGSPTLLESSILANNAVNGLASDFAIGNTPSGDHNLIQSFSGPIAAGSYISACPELGPLRDNGGPTFTHAVQSGSPVIGAGANPTTLEYDQRGVGYLREISTMPPDIGAYQVQPEEIFSAGFDGCTLP